MPWKRILPTGYEVSILEAFHSAMPCMARDGFRVGDFRVLCMSR